MKAIDGDALLDWAKEFYNHPTVISAIKNAPTLDMPPCKVGDVFWTIEDGNVIKIRVYCIAIFEETTKIHYNPTYKGKGYGYTFEPKDIGDTVFFTKEEAIKHNQELKYKNKG